MSLLLKLRLNPEYVDQMEFFECIAALKHQEYAIQDGWEQARLIAYMVAQTNSTKRLKPEDIIGFAWDKKTHTANADSVSNVAAERLAAKAAKMAEMMSRKDRDRDRDRDKYIESIYDGK